MEEQQPPTPKDEEDDGGVLFSIATIADGEIVSIFVLVCFFGALVLFFVEYSTVIAASGFWMLLN